MGIWGGLPGEAGGFNEAEPEGPVSFRTGHSCAEARSDKLPQGGSRGSQGAKGV